MACLHQCQRKLREGGRAMAPTVRAQAQTGYSQPREERGEAGGSWPQNPLGVSGLRGCTDPAPTLLFLCSFPSPSLSFLQVARGFWKALWSPFLVLCVTEAVCRCGPGLDLAARLSSTSRAPGCSGVWARSVLPPSQGAFIGTPTSAAFQGARGGWEVVGCPSPCAAGPAGRGAAHFPRVWFMRRPLLLFCGRPFLLCIFL